MAGFVTTRKGARKRPSCRILGFPACLREVSRLQRLGTGCLWLLLLLATASGTAGRADAEPRPGEIVPPVRAFVTIDPQAYFVERIGGERVRVEVLVGPGQCAETFEATPKQLARMAGARLYFSIGMPMEETLVPRLRGNFPGLQVVDSQQGVPRRDFEEYLVSGDVELATREQGAARHDDDHAGEIAGDDHSAHHHEGADPHTWLDPRRAKMIARNIAGGLTQASPADSAVFRTNLRALETELDHLDAELREVLAPVRGREMLVYHPFYGYFADAYGLKQTAIEVGGSRPGSKYLSAVIDRAKRSGTRAIFVQKGVALSAAETVAEEIHGRVIVLDPLARDYLANLREMARRVRDGLAGR